MFETGIQPALWLQNISFRVFFWALLLIFPSCQVTVWAAHGILGTVHLVGISWLIITLDLRWRELTLADIIHAQTHINMYKYSQLHSHTLHIFMSVYVYIIYHIISYHHIFISILFITIYVMNGNQQITSLAVLSQSKWAKNPFPAPQACWTRNWEKAMA